MTDRENVQAQIAGWMTIALLVSIMVVVAFSDEQRVMAFLFPDWLSHTLLFRAMKKLGPMNSVLPVLAVLLFNSFRAHWKKRAAKNGAEAIP